MLSNSLTSTFYNISLKRQGSWLVEKDCFENKYSSDDDTERRSHRTVIKAVRPFETIKYVTLKQTKDRGAGLY